MADFAYRCEYAKSGRASCKGCKTPIGKEELRLAVMVQSRHFDGKQPNWFHFNCFFEKQRPKSTDDIEYFDSLRWEDQEKVKNNIANPSAASAETGNKRKGKKRKSEAVSIGLNDFKVENAKSSRAKCRGCENIILKNEVRISKKDFESEIGKMYGGQEKWHHLDCFVKMRNQLEFWDDGKALPGFESLSKEHQEIISKSLPKIAPVAVKIEEKNEDDEPPANKIIKTDVDEKKLKEQNKILYKYRDQLKDNLNKNELTELLQYNDRSIPIGKERMLDILGDLITFGVPGPCSECSGELVYSTGIGYKCTGDVTEWTKCLKVIVDPKKSKFRIPHDLKKKHSFLNSYKYVSRLRLFKPITPTNVVKKEETETGPLIKRDALPLENMKFYIIGKTKSSKASLKDKISKLGGRVVTSLSESVTAVISTKDEVEDKSPQMSSAENMKIHVIEEDFLKEIKKTKSKIIDLIVEKSICNWGSEIEKRVEKSMPSKSNKSKSIFTKSVPSSQKLTLKGGIAVDPDSNLEDVAHVLKDNGNVYNSVLGITDLDANKNSFYKLQVLESDKSSRYWLFRSWGRIGTNIGGSRVEDMTSKANAIAKFKDLYEERTGNDWSDRDNFIKVPSKMYPVDVEYDETDHSGDNQFNSSIPSSLPTTVQQLVKLLFDIDTMKRVMKEFELDLDKMPLGKLSQKQLQKAFGVLTELQDLLKSSGPENRFIDASNRFYTLVPHSFGVNSLPQINSEEKIKEKVEMLNSLMDISIAYSLIKGNDSKETNPIDKHYEKLQTDIEPLDKKSEEFQLLQKYVDNTHAATHQSYKLVIEEVFKIKRQNEEKRYKPFKKLPNKKLLWHGSRLTNFAGILSQGLRIAPPEAPTTGYMFGKGIYFADMVSKSANYCFTSPNNSTGLMLLCEVALGNMMECTQAKYIEKLPKNKQSCKGLGRTHPNPKDSVTLPNGVEVPVGKGISSDSNNTALLYNEYIVYDVAQVNMKYLLKLDFKYKY